MSVRSDELTEELEALRAEVKQLREEKVSDRAVLSIPEVYEGIVSDAVIEELEYYQAMARGLQDRLARGERACREQMEPWPGDESDRPSEGALVAARILGAFGSQP